MTTLDPQAQAVLDDMARASAGRTEPGDAAERLARARADTDGLVRFTPSPAPVPVATRRVEGRHGPVPVEIYGEPAGPLLVWFHGGGAIAGSIDTHRGPLSEIARRSGWVVASVGYRLAPKHPFPVPQEDCLDAALALAETASGPLVLGGDSIGGLFVAEALRHWSGAAPAGQILLYPNTDMRPDRSWPSLAANEGRVMTRASLAYEAECHFPQAARRGTPDASPLLADDLAGQPPALVVTCEGDPLRDEGEAYVQSLREAGVAVRHRRFSGMIHAFLQMGGRIEATQALLDEVGAFLADARSKQGSRANAAPGA